MDTVANPEAKTGLVNPGDVAVLLPWAIRYAAGRHFTGAYEYPEAVASWTICSFTAAELAGIREQCQYAAEVARRAAERPEMGVSRAEALAIAGRWDSLITRIDAIEPAAEGVERDMVDVGLDRRFAMTALSAVRWVTGYSWNSDEITDERGQAVADAIFRASPQFSSSDLVLVLADIAAQAETCERMQEPFAMVWRRLYGRLRALPLDESYALLRRIPDSLT